MGFVLKKYALGIFWGIARPLQYVYWFVVRPETRGVRCIIENDGKFLFVKLGYGPKHWTVPGGGVDRGETDEDAMRREVFEEVGLRLGNVIKLAEYKNNIRYKRDTVVVFYSKSDSDRFNIDDIEIVDAQWGLPQDLSAPVSPRIALFEQMMLNHKNGNKTE